MRTSSIPLLLIPLTTAAVAICSDGPAPATAQACNGNPTLCSRTYSNTSQIGTHDAAFVGTFPTDNQAQSVTSQLNAGIRFLEAQTHKELLSGTLSMCHTSCFLRDAGSLVSFLTTVKAWLDTNPDEVLTLLLANGDNVDVGLFGDAFVASGADADAFVPASSPDTLAIDDWPTLQDMIASGKRLVTFLDYGANTSSTPHILDEYAYFFDTPYDTTDPTFPQCTLARPPDASPSGRMYILNHFLDLDIAGVDVPDVGADNATNAAVGNGSIGAQVDLCVETYGREPKVVLVDNFEYGDVFKAQDGMNGL